MRVSKPILYFFRLLILMPLCCQSQDCAKVKISDFPAGDLPINWDTANIRRKESSRYYYGVGVPVDYVKARRFAFIEMKTYGDEASAFEGPSILMMLYANGFGVKRNLDLCIRLACANIGSSEAEAEGRMNHLKQIKAGDSTGIFDLCDDITSGYMMGMCRGQLSELSEVKRNSALDSVMKTWTDRDRVAYKRLRKAASAFFDARVLKEVDESGTARVMLMDEESDALEDVFTDEIMKSDQCGFVLFSSTDYSRADSALNGIYSKIMNAESPIWGTTTKAGIKQTQRTWIRYRDAWVVFGKQKCPKRDDVVLKTLITKERIAQLRVFLDE